MIVVGEAARAAARRVDVPIQNGTRLAAKTDWLDSGRDASLSPNVFLVDLPPESVLDPHFHRENQFQLFVKGEGSIGRHPIRPITVHYAGAFTGYGPLAAGPQGVSYFTIRPVYDTGAFYLPHARDDMVPGPKRNLHSRPVTPLDADALHGLQTPQLLDLIALQPDRIAARLLRLPRARLIPISILEEAEGNFSRSSRDRSRTASVCSDPSTWSSSRPMSRRSVSARRTTAPKSSSFSCP